MRIDVTADDIRRGKMEDCCRCPVALAAARAFGLTTTGSWLTSPVRVFPSSLAIEEKDLIRLPPGVAAFICAFDMGMPVAPFFFELEADGATEAG
jgi:hypothetical protein